MSKYFVEINIAQHYGIVQRQRTQLSRYSMSKMAENNIDSHRTNAIVLVHNPASMVTAVTFVSSRLLFLVSTKRSIIRDMPRNPFCGVNILIKRRLINDGCPSPSTKFNGIIFFFFLFVLLYLTPKGDKKE